MLTNGFTREEIAGCVPGATTLTCTESVVMYRTTKVAFTAGQKYEIKSMSDPWMVTIDNFGKDHVLDGLFFRKHFALNKSRDAIHLSETGLHAGRGFCGASREDGSRSVHAMYAPLQSPEFRGKVCEACLTAWALEAYSEGEPMPDYIAEVRHKHKATCARVVVTAAPVHQLAVESQ